MAAGRVHSKCGGRGYVTLASGADGHCFGCNGTGVYTPATKEQRQARADWKAAYVTLTGMPRDFTGVAGVRPMDFRQGVLAGLQKLAASEPGRLPALYASLRAGRNADVAVALYDYGRTISPYESLYCTSCHRDSLPWGIRCDRSEIVKDNGPVQPENIDSRYEGTCLKCCEHNHG